MDTELAVVLFTPTDQLVAATPLVSGEGRLACTTTLFWAKNPPPVTRSPALQLANAVP
jgi:hypothetical protein